MLVARASRALRRPVGPYLNQSRGRSPLRNSVRAWRAEPGPCDDMADYALATIGGIDGGGRPSHEGDQWTKMSRERRGATS